MELTDEDLQAVAEQIGEAATVSGSRPEISEPTFTGKRPQRPNTIVIEPVRVSLADTESLIQLHTAVGGMIQAIAAVSGTEERAKRAMGILYGAIAKALGD